MVSAEGTLSTDCSRFRGHFCLFSSMLAAWGEMPVHKPSLYEPTSYFFPRHSPRSAKSTTALVHSWGRRRMDAEPCLAASVATISTSRCSLPLRRPLTQSLGISGATRALVTQQSLATAQPPAAQHPQTPGELRALLGPCLSSTGGGAGPSPGLWDQGSEDVFTCLLKGSWRQIMCLTPPFNHCLPGSYLNGCPRGARLASALPNYQAI